MDLSLRKDMRERISDFQVELLNEELLELPVVNDGDVNISTIFVFDDGEKVETKIFVRNGLDKALNLEYVPLVMTNSENKVVGKQIFNMKDLGLIPPKSARPYKLYFDKASLVEGMEVNKDCKVVFDTNLVAKKTLQFEFQNLPEELPSFYKEKYLNFLNSLDAISEGEVSISTYDVNMNNEGNLSITLIIRNGAPKQVKIEKLPIVVKDAKADIIAKGIFELKDTDIVIDPKKALLYNFVFNKENFLLDRFDLNSYSVEFTI